MSAPHLTRREREILVAAAEGATIEETAHQLGISPQTAKNTRRRVMARYDAASLVDLFRIIGWLKVPTRAITTQPWHCRHGLDLRLHERCYLCDPALPLKITSVPCVSTGTATVRCTCPPDRGDMYAGNCPVHDVQVTYTGGVS